jgi:hypothetical protein
MHCQQVLAEIGFQLALIKFEVTLSPLLPE